MKEKRSKVKLLCDAGSTMVRRTLRQASKAGIVAALVPLGMIGLPGQANAQVQRSSWVDGAVTQQPNGQYLYEFTVHNTTGDDDDTGYGYGGELVVDWELPLIVAPGQDWTHVVSNIQSPGWDDAAPAGAVPGGVAIEPWYYEVITPDGTIQETSDPFSPGPGSASYYYDNPNGPYGQYDWNWTKESDPVWQDDNDVYGPNPDQFLDPDYIIHWYTHDEPGDSPVDPIWPFESRMGYSFISDYSAGNAPYMASWFFEEPTIGDPPFPAGSLPALPGPTGPIGGIVPLPAAFPIGFIVMSGMAGVGYLRRRAAR